MPRGDHKHLSMAYKHGYKLEQKNQRGASRALFVRCSHPQFELLIFKLERHVETWRFALYHYLFPARCSLFVRARTRCSYEFARCSYEFAYAVRALFVRCSYAARTLFVRVRTSANSPANYATRPSGLVFYIAR